MLRSGDFCVDADNDNKQQNQLLYPCTCVQGNEAMTVQLLGQITYM